MKAVVLNGYGGTEKLIVSEVPLPVIKPTEVLVAVKAFSVNPADTLVRANEALDWIFGGSDIKIPGWDVSGIVVETGNLVSMLKIGDEVFGCINHPGSGKTYAEYVAAPAEHLAIKPANISHDEAAAVPLAALTALQAFQRAGIKENDRVFITAAGGGVGHLAIQIAKYFKAYVIALASAKKKDFVYSLKADLFIDYQNQQFEHLVKEVDIALDAVREKNHILRSLDILKTGGTLVSLWSQITDKENEKARLLGVNAFYNAIRASGKDMALIAELLQSGALQPYISAAFSMVEIRNAHIAIESNHTMGKIIVRIN